MCVHVHLRQPTTGNYSNRRLRKFSVLTFLSSSATVEILYTEKIKFRHACSCPCTERSCLSIYCSVNSRQYDQSSNHLTLIRVHNIPTGRRSIWGKILPEVSRMVLSVLMRKGTPYQPTNVHILLMKGSIFHDVIIL